MKMKTRFNNLNYEHRHDGYGWHLKTRIHKEPEYRVTCRCGEVVDIPYHTYSAIICQECGEEITMKCLAKICMRCGKFGEDGTMEYDEQADGFVCDECVNKQELCILSK